MISWSARTRIGSDVLREERGGLRLGCRVYDTMLGGHQPMSRIPWPLRLTYAHTDAWLPGKDMRDVARSSDTGASIAHGTGGTHVRKIVYLEEQGRSKTSK